MQQRGVPRGYADGATATGKGFTVAKTVTLKDDQSGKSWKFPVLSGTTGPDVVDIRKFYAETNMFTSTFGTWLIFGKS